MDEIQPNLVCMLLTWMGCATINFFFGPVPLGRGQKVKYHLISITKSISKIFKPNFVCLLTNERYKTYQTGFSFRRLGHAPGWDLGVPWGLSRSNFFSEIQPELVCELLTSHATAQFFGSLPPWGLGEGPKGQISLIKSQLLSQFQIF